MVSQYEHAAWANLGPGLTNVFQDWGRQRARRAELDAQVAQAELARRDAKDAREEMAELNREYFRIAKEKADRDAKRYEEDLAEKEELESILGGLALGKPDIPAAGRIAGQEWVSGIREADGFLPQVRAAVAGLLPAMQKGARDTPREDYATPGEYVREAGLSREQAGKLMKELGPEAFAPVEPDLAAAQNYASLYTMGLIESDGMPDDIPWNLEGLDAARDVFAKATTDEQKKSALQIANEEASLAYRQKATKLLGTATGGGKKPEIDTSFLDEAPVLTPQEQIMTQYGISGDDAANLSAGITNALAQPDVSREALEAELVNNYNFSDADAKALLDELVGSSE